MTKILITGANGQVGQSFQKMLSAFPAYNFDLLSRSELDISDADQVNNLFAEKEYDWIINCAAYTKVDLAEQESEICYAINETGSANLALAAQEIGASIIHISTDYVYHSNFGQPFTEESVTNPQSIYAKSKLAGEHAVAKYCDQHYILRTSWVYAEHGHNFVRTMLRLGEERDNLSVVCDQIGAPTYAYDLAQTIMAIIQRPEQNYGTYNFANEGQTSWYNLTRAILDHQNLECLVTPIRTDEYPTAAIRPPYSIMDLNKIKDFLKIDIRDWEKALENCLNNIHTHV